jgi:hypothetical protein
MVALLVIAEAHANSIAAVVASRKELNFNGHFGNPLSEQRMGTSTPT